MDPTSIVSLGVAGVFTLAVYMCCSLPLQIQIKNASPQQIVALAKVMYTVCRIIVLDKINSFFGFLPKNDNNCEKSKDKDKDKDEGKKLSKKPRSMQSLPPSGLVGIKTHLPLPPSPPDTQEINSPILNNTEMNLSEMQFENDLIDLGQY